MDFYTTSIMTNEFLCVIVIIERENGPRVQKGNYNDKHSNVNKLS
jgi:hypothetical protein